MFGNNNIRATKRASSIEKKTKVPLIKMILKVLGISALVVAVVGGGVTLAFYLIGKKQIEATSISFKNLLGESIEYIDWTYDVSDESTNTLSFMLAGEPSDSNKENIKIMFATVDGSAVGTDFVDETCYNELTSNKYRLGDVINLKLKENVTNFDGLIKIRAYIPNKIMSNPLSIYVDRSITDIAVSSSSNMVSQGQFIGPGLSSVEIDNNTVIPSQTITTSDVNFQVDIQLPDNYSLYGYNKELSDLGELYEKEIMYFYTSKSNSNISYTQLINNDDYMNSLNVPFAFDINGNLKINSSDEGTNTYYLTILAFKDIKSANYIKSQTIYSQDNIYNAKMLDIKEMFTNMDNFLDYVVCREVAITVTREYINSIDIGANGLNLNLFNDNNIYLDYNSENISSSLSLTQDGGKKYTGGAVQVLNQFTGNIIAESPSSGDIVAISGINISDLYIGNQKVESINPNTTFNLKCLDESSNSVKSIKYQIDNMFTDFVIFRLPENIGKALNSTGEKFIVVNAEDNGSYFLYYGTYERFSIDPASKTHDIIYNDENAITVITVGGKVVRGEYFNFTLNGTLNTVSSQVIINKYSQALGGNENIILNYNATNGFYEDNTKTYSIYFESPVSSNLNAGTYYGKASYGNSSSLNCIFKMQVNGSSLNNTSGVFYNAESDELVDFSNIDDDKINLLATQKTSDVDYFSGTILFVLDSNNLGNLNDYFSLGETNSEYFNLKSISSLTNDGLVLKLFVINANGSVISDSVSVTLSAVNGKPSFTNTDLNFTISANDLQKEQDTIAFKQNANNYAVNVDESIAQVQSNNSYKSIVLLVQENQLGLYGVERAKIYDNFVSIQINSITYYLVGIYDKNSGFSNVILPNFDGATEITLYSITLKTMPETDLSLFVSELIENSQNGVILESNFGQISTDVLTINVSFTDLVINGGVDSSVENFAIYRYVSSSASLPEGISTELTEFVVIDNNTLSKISGYSFNNSSEMYVENSGAFDKYSIVSNNWAFKEGTTISVSFTINELEPLMNLINSYNPKVLPVVMQLVDNEYVENLNASEYISVYESSFDAESNSLKYSFILNKDLVNGFITFKLSYNLNEWSEGNLPIIYSCDADIYSIEPVCDEIQIVAKLNGIDFEFDILGENLGTDVTLDNLLQVIKDNSKVYSKDKIFEVIKDIDVTSLNSSIINFKEDGTVDSTSLSTGEAILRLSCESAISTIKISVVIEDASLTKTNKSTDIKRGNYNLTDWFDYFVAGVNLDNNIKFEIVSVNYQYILDNLYIDGNNLYIDNTAFDFNNLLITIRASVNFVSSGSKAIEITLNSSNGINISRNISVNLDTLYANTTIRFAGVNAIDTYQKITLDGVEVSDLAFTYEYADIPAGSEVFKAINGYFDIVLPKYVTGFDTINIIFYYGDPDSIIRNFEMQFKNNLMLSSNNSENNRISLVSGESLSSNELKDIIIVKSINATNAVTTYSQAEIVDSNLYSLNLVDNSSSYYTVLDNNLTVNYIESLSNVLDDIVLTISYQGIEENITIYLTLSNGLNLVSSTDDVNNTLAFEGKQSSETTDFVTVNLMANKTYLLENVQELNLANFNHLFEIVKVLTFTGSWGQVTADIEARIIDNTNFVITKISNISSSGSILDESNASVVSLKYLIGKVFTFNQNISTSFGGEYYTYSESSGNRFVNVSRVNDKITNIQILVEPKSSFTLITENDLCKSNAITTNFYSIRYIGNLTDSVIIDNDEMQIKVGYNYQNQEVSILSKIKFNISPLSLLIKSTSGDNKELELYAENTYNIMTLFKSDDFSAFTSIEFVKLTGIDDYSFENRTYTVANGGPINLRFGSIVGDSANLTVTIKFNYVGGGFTQKDYSFTIYNKYSMSIQYPANDLNDDVLENLGFTNYEIVRDNQVINLYQDKEFSNLQRLNVFARSSVLQGDFVSVVELSKIISSIEFYQSTIDAITTASDKSIFFDTDVETGSITLLDALIGNEGYITFKISTITNAYCYYTIRIDSSKSSSPLSTSLTFKSDGETNVENMLKSLLLGGSIRIFNENNQIIDTLDETSDFASKLSAYSLSDSSILGFEKFDNVISTNIPKMNNADETLSLYLVYKYAQNQVYIGVINVNLQPNVIINKVDSSLQKIDDLNYTLTKTYDYDNNNAINLAQLFEVKDAKIDTDVYSLDSVTILNSINNYYIEIDNNILTYYDVPENEIINLLLTYKLDDNLVEVKLDLTIQKQNHIKNITTTIDPTTIDFDASDYSIYLTDLFENYSSLKVNNIENLTSDENLLVFDNNKIEFTSVNTTTTYRIVVTLYSGLTAEKEIGNYSAIVVVKPNIKYSFNAENVLAVANTNLTDYGSAIKVVKNPIFESVLQGYVFSDDYANIEFYLESNSNNAYLGPEVEEISDGVKHYTNNSTYLKSANNLIISSGNYNYKFTYVNGNYQYLGYMFVSNNNILLAVNVDATNSTKLILNVDNSEFSDAVNFVKTSENVDILELENQIILDFETANEILIKFNHLAGNEFDYYNFKFNVTVNFDDITNFSDSSLNVTLRVPTTYEISPIYVVSSATNEAVQVGSSIPISSFMGMISTGSEKFNEYRFKAVSTVDELQQIDLYKTIADNLTLYYPAETILDTAIEIKDNNIYFNAVGNKSIQIKDKFTLEVLCEYNFNILSREDYASYNTINYADELNIYFVNANDTTSTTTKVLTSSEFSQKSFKLKLGSVNFSSSYLGVLSDVGQASLSFVDNNNREYSYEQLESLNYSVVSNTGNFYLTISWDNNEITSNTVINLSFFNSSNRMSSALRIYIADESNVLNVTGGNYQNLTTGNLTMFAGSYDYAKFVIKPTDLSNSSGIIKFSIGGIDYSSFEALQNAGYTLLMSSERLGNSYFDVIESNGNFVGEYITFNSGRIYSPNKVSNDLIITLHFILAKSNTDDNLTINYNLLEFDFSVRLTKDSELVWSGSSSDTQSLYLADITAQDNIYNVNLVEENEFVPTLKIKNLSTLEENNIDTTSSSLYISSISDANNNPLAGITVSNFTLKISDISMSVNTLGYVNIYITIKDLDDSSFEQVMILRAYSSINIATYTYGNDNVVKTDESGLAYASSDIVNFITPNTVANMGGVAIYQKTSNGNVAMNLVNTNSTDSSDDDYFNIGVTYSYALITNVGDIANYSSDCILFNENDKFNSVVNGTSILNNNSITVEKDDNNKYLLKISLPIVPVDKDYIVVYKITIVKNGVENVCYAYYLVGNTININLNTDLIGDEEVVRTNISDNLESDYITLSSNLVNNEQKAFVEYGDFDAIFSKMQARINVISGFENESVKYILFDIEKDTGVYKLVLNNAVYKDINNNILATVDSFKIDNELKFNLEFVSKENDNQIIYKFDNLTLKPESENSLILNNYSMKLSDLGFSSSQLKDYTGESTIGVVNSVNNDELLRLINDSNGVNVEYEVVVEDLTIFATDNKASLYKVKYTKDSAFNHYNITSTYYVISSIINAFVKLDNNLIVDTLNGYNITYNRVVIMNQESTKSVNLNYYLKAYSFDSNLGFNELTMISNYGNNVVSYNQATTENATINFANSSLETINCKINFILY